MMLKRSVKHPQGIKVIKSSQQLYNLNILYIQFLKQPPKDGLFVVRLREWIPSTFHFQSSSLHDKMIPSAGLSFPAF